MEIKDALKSIGPAVGDGKLVWQHAYVFFDGESLRACNGFLWAAASITPIPSAFVRYDALANAMDRDGAEVLPREDHGLIARAGRSRLQLKGSDPATFPPEPTTPNRWAVSPRVGFVDTLRVLSAFCGKPDNHIWQMGVHFMEDFAFAANPYALTVRPGRQFQSPISFPPWATKFILAQPDSPNVVADCDRHMTLLWGHRLSLTSTLLIEEPAENIVSYAARIVDDPTSGVLVPENLKAAVQRVKELGATRVRIGNGKIDHMTEALEFEEDVGIDTAPRVWGIDPLLAALEHATEINLADSPAKWEGGGYKGVFSGMSG